MKKEIWLTQVLDGLFSCKEFLEEKLVLYDDIVECSNKNTKFYNRGKIIAFFNDRNKQLIIYS